MKLPFPRFLWRGPIHPIHRFCIGLAGLFILGVVCLYAWARIEWARTKNELLAKGERLTLVEMAPRPIPDSQNFFADPIWMELADLVPVTDEKGNSSMEPRLPRGQRKIDAINVPLSQKEVDEIGHQFPKLKIKESRFQTANLIWRYAKESNETDQIQKHSKIVLDLLQPAHPLLDRLSQLGERPGSRFPINYAAGPLAPLPHFGYLLQAAQILKLRAEAELALGQIQAARQDALLILRLSESEGEEPILISLLVRMSNLQMAADVINAGIVSHQWSQSDLDALLSPPEHLTPPQ